MHEKGEFVVRFAESQSRLIGWNRRRQLAQCATRMMDNAARVGCSVLLGWVGLGWIGIE